MWNRCSSHQSSSCLRGGGKTWGKRLGDFPKWENQSRCVQGEIGVNTIFHIAMENGP